MPTTILSPPLPKVARYARPSGFPAAVQRVLPPRMAAQRVVPGGALEDVVAVAADETCAGRDVCKAEAARGRETLKSASLGAILNPSIWQPDADGANLGMLSPVVA